MQTRVRIVAGIVAVLALGLLGSRPAWGATVSANLSGTFPVQITPGETVPQAFAVQLDVTGSLPSSKTASIEVCNAVTLNADGTGTCTGTTSISLTPGNNYSQNKLGFPRDVQVALTCASGVACGLIYELDELLSLTTTGGADFGDGAIALALAFTVQVNCVAADQGCSHGFWKNHPTSWPSPYTENTTLGSQFPATNDAAIGLGAATFAEALAFPGGSTLQAAAQILMRQAVAALLNAASGIEYPRTAAEVVSQVNAALQTQTRSEILALAAALDGDNNLGCPLPE